MKKMFALVLVVVMCLSVCACSVSANRGQDSGDDNSGNGSAVDLEKLLLNGGAFWCRANRHMVGVGFLSDGTTVEPEGTWQLDGDTVNCVWAEGGTASYVFRELNGVYYLVGDDMVMFSDAYVVPDEIPSRAVEITLDNWQEYFAFTHETEEVLDQFGDATGEIRENYYLELKPEYDRLLVEENSEVLIRYTQNGDERDACLRGWTIDYFGEYNIRNDAEYSFEMIRVEGTLYFIDGIE